ncbi:hypothetical protein Clacol_005147 [Clathrus columnatus]|uniref:Uncharacterized protein n=1 Tax=Clathrus columnatus TaxID=1419009 RepID=A0AAV5AE22_9AGAM|nr:hypothetical protein Clacol_005147 [Clathrus columnatus]
MTISSRPTTIPIIIRSNPNNHNSQLYKVTDANHPSQAQARFNHERIRVRERERELPALPTSQPSSDHHRQAYSLQHRPPPPWIRITPNPPSFPRLSNPNYHERGYSEYDHPRQRIRIIVPSTSRSPSRSRPRKYEPKRTFPRIVEEEDSHLTSSSSATARPAPSREREAVSTPPPTPDPDFDPNSHPNPNSTPAPLTFLSDTQLQTQGNHTNRSNQDQHSHSGHDIPTLPLSLPPTPSPSPPPSPPQDQATSNPQMSRYQEHFTPSQVSLASTQYRLRESLRSPGPAPSVSSGGGGGTRPPYTPGSGTTGPGLYGPSPPPGTLRRPPRPPRHPTRTTVPAPLAPSMLGTLGQGQQQGVRMNNIPPSGTNATGSGVVSLNTPPPPPTPQPQIPITTSAQPQPQPQPGQPLPSIVLTSESRANSPIILRGTNGGLSQERVTDSLAREKEREERDREKERRERARMLVGLRRRGGMGGVLPSPPVSPSRGRDSPSGGRDGVTSPSASVSRSIPPALMPGGGIEIPAGVHITSHEDSGRFRPTSADIRLGEPDLRNMVGKVVKGLRGLRAFTGGLRRNKTNDSGKAKSFFGGRFDDVKEEEFDNLVSPPPRLTDSPEGMNYPRPWNGAPVGTPGAGPSTYQTPTPRQTPPSPARGGDRTAPDPYAAVQSHLHPSPTTSRPTSRDPLRAQTPAPSEVPTFLTNATEDERIPTREDLLLQDYMRRKRIMRDRAFRSSTDKSAGRKYVPWATSSPPTTLPPLGGRRRNTGSAPPPMPIPVPGNSAAVPPPSQNVPLGFPEPQISQNPIPPSISQESVSATPTYPPPPAPTGSELEALRAAEEEREVDDYERERRGARGWRARNGSAGGGVNMPGGLGGVAEEGEEGDQHLPTPTSVTESPFIPPAPATGAIPSALRSGPTQVSNSTPQEDLDRASRTATGFGSRFLPPRSRRSQTPGAGTQDPAYSATSISYQQPPPPASGTYNFTGASGPYTPSYSYASFASGPTPPASRVFTRWTALVDAYGRRVANPYYRESRSRSREREGRVPENNTTFPMPARNHTHPRPSSILSYSSPLGGFLRLLKQIFHMPWVGNRVVADIVPGGIMSRRKKGGKGYYADGGVMSETVTITGVGSDIGSEEMSDLGSEVASDLGSGSGSGSGTAIPYPRAGREYESIASRLYSASGIDSQQNPYFPPLPHQRKRDRYRMFRFAPRSKPGKSWYSRPGERFLERQRARERARERDRERERERRWGGGRGYPSDSNSFMPMGYSATGTGTGRVLPNPGYYSSRTINARRRGREPDPTLGSPLLANSVPDPGVPPPFNPLPRVPSGSRLREMKRRLREEEAGNSVVTGSGAVPESLRPGGRDEHGHEHHTDGGDGPSQNQPETFTNIPPTTSDPNAPINPNPNEPLSPTPSFSQPPYDSNVNPADGDDMYTQQSLNNPDEMLAYANRDYDFITLPAGQAPPAGFIPYPYDIPEDAEPVVIPVRFNGDDSQSGIGWERNGGRGGRGNGGRERNGERVYRNVGQRERRAADDDDSQTQTQTYTQTQTQTYTQTGTHLQPPTVTATAPSATTATGVTGNAASYIFIPRSGPRRREFENGRGGYEYQYDRIRVPRSGAARDQRRRQWVFA